MNTIIFALPGNIKLATNLAKKLDASVGKITIRNFPDEESYIRIHDDVTGKKVVLVCSLHQPNAKLLPLYFLSNAAKNLGAKCTCLVAHFKVLCPFGFGLRRQLDYC